MPENIIARSGAEDRCATTDNGHAFIIKVSENSMWPRYQPGEYALIEPAYAPESEDDVLVRLVSGETKLRRFLGRHDGKIRFGTYNPNACEVKGYTEPEITCIYYVSNRVPAHKIKHWGKSAGFFFSPPLIRK